MQSAPLGGLVTTSVSETASASAAESPTLARCVACGHSRAEPSPLDPEGSSERSWSHGGRGAQCQLCFEATVILERRGALPIGIHGSGPWQLMCQAYASLCLESTTEIDAKGLLSRYEVLVSVQRLARGGRNVGPAHVPSSGAGSDRHSPSSAGSGPPTRRALEAALATPTKGADPPSAGPSHRRSANSGTKRALSISELSPSTPSSQAARVSQRSSRASSVADIEEHREATLRGYMTSEVPELSIQGQFCDPDIGPSLGTIRNTINSYAQRMCTIEWYSEFKSPTTKALQRRLMNYEGAVKASVDIDMLRAWDALRQRIAAVILSYRALARWRTTNTDDSLMQFLLHIKPVQKYLERVGTPTLGPELYIIHMLAKFVEAVALGAPIVEALKHVDHSMLLSCFAELQAPEQLRSNIKLELDDDDDDDGNMAGDTLVKEEGGGAPKCDPNSAKKKAPVPFIKLISARDGLEFAARMIDKVLLPKLHGMSVVEEERRQQAGDLARELQPLAGEWRRRFGSGGIAGVVFAELLEALMTVCQSCSNEGQQPLVPSAIRDAMNLIHKAATSPIKPSLKCVEAMGLFEGCLALMEGARLLASAGLQDEAADGVFQNGLKAIEDRMLLAFESIEQWASRGNEGRWQDFGSMDNHVKAVAQILLDIRMAMGQWSLARLEQQVLGISDAFNCALLVLDMVGIVAARELVVALPVPHLFLAPVVGEPSVGSGDATCAQEPCAAKTSADAGPSTSHAGDIKAEVLKGDGDIAPMVKIGGAARCIAPRLDGFLSAAIQQLESAKRLHNDLAEKVGQTFLASMSEYGINIEASLAKATNNKDMLMACCKYFEDAAWLHERAPLTLEELGSDSEDTAIYMTTLASFSGAHQSLGAEMPFDIQTAADVAELAMSLNFASTAAEIKAAFCDALFDLHALPTTRSAITWLEQMSRGLTLNPLDGKCLENFDKPNELFRIIVPSPMLATLSSWMPAPPTQDALLAAADTMPHNKVLSSLVSFVEAIGLSEIPTTMMRRCMETEGEAQPAQHALHILTLDALLQTTASLGASIHTVLFGPPERKDPPSLQAQTETVPTLCHLLGEKLQDLDKMLHTPLMAEIEAEGWHLPHPISLAKLWQNSMAKFRLKCVMYTLGLWAKDLDSLAVQSKASCPDWQVCMRSDGTWNDHLAAGMLKGKSKIIAKTHNVLYDRLALLSNAAATMSVSPRLQDHEVTSQSIAVALHNMEHLKNSSVVAEGTQLLITYRDHHLAHKKATEFIARCSPSAHPGIPAAFWSQFELMAADIYTALCSSSPPPAIVAKEPPTELGSGMGPVAAATSDGAAKREAPSVAHSSTSEPPRRALKRRRA